MRKAAKNEAEPEQDLPTVLNLRVSIPLAATTYEGFGQGITNLAAAASIGLRIPLPPVYCVGVVTALIYAYIKLRDTQNKVAMRRELIIARKRNLTTDHHRQYWSATGPKFIKGDEEVELKWIIENLSAEEIADCLGFYYQIIVHGTETFLQHNKLFGTQREELIELRQRLALKIAGEASQFKNHALEQRLNTACGTPIVAIPAIEKPSALKQFWNNLRKYYKSILTGAATGGGLTVIIVETAMSTATLTAWFPWSIFIILAALLLGGVVGYFLDKVLDRQHKNELSANAALTLNEQNKKRLGNLWVDLSSTLNKLEDYVPGISTINPSAEWDPVPIPLPSLQPELDYCEVRDLKQQSHIKRKIADFILPTLIAARAAFGAVSSVFAGLAFAGLILPWWPVVIIGGVMLLLFITFKIINNGIKHRSEERKIQDLNLLISAEKFGYWNSVLRHRDNVRYAKENSTEQILSDLKDQYEKFKQVLSSFKLDHNNPDHKELHNALLSLHSVLLMTYRAHADNLYNKQQLATLYSVALACPPQAIPPQKIITLGDKIKNILSIIDRFIVRNFKDIVQGFAFGFGTTLTIFALMGLTGSLLAAWPLTVIIGACLLGIAIKVAIRYGIKAYRNQRLLDTEIHGEKPIKDKEQLLDCQAATAIATQDVYRISKKYLDQHESTDEREPEEVRSLPQPRLKRPLLWIESAGSVAKKQEEDLVPSAQLDPHLSNDIAMQPIACN